MDKILKAVVNKEVIEMNKGKESIDKRLVEKYDEDKNNPNDFSKWFPKIKDCGIKVPESVVIPLSLEQFAWLISDNYKPEEINKFNDEILESIKETGFNTDRKLFMKTGTFSNKFDFDVCEVTDMKEIGEKYLTIFYQAMCVGAGCNTELVLREFIESDKTNSIYGGMPLNTEFRAFYDFDKKELLDVFNYWDKDTMNKSLIRDEKIRAFIDSLDLSKSEDVVKINDLTSKIPDYMIRSVQDYVSFNKECNSMELEFSKLKEQVSKLISSKMENVDLEGIWSVDIMYANNQCWLIDMALGKNSYYYNKLKL